MTFFIFLPHVFFSKVCRTILIALTYYFIRRKLTEEDKVGLQNEIMILKQVDHPNIVKLYDIYEDEKYWFLVMELMMGGEVTKLVSFYVLLII